LVEVGTRIGIAYYTVRLAEARECAGTIVEVLETVEQALQASHPDAHISRLEALWLRGELRLTQEDKNLAGGDFREAIEIARRQSAKSLELRTAVSLARLLRDTNRRDEAHTVLAEIYTWFTEGFDLTDLKDARALLEELGA
jgi:hypothetical protein